MINDEFKFDINQFIKMNDGEINFDEKFCTFFKDNNISYKNMMGSNTLISNAENIIKVKIDLNAIKNLPVGQQRCVIITLFDNKSILPIYLEKCIDNDAIDFFKLYGIFFHYNTYDKSDTIIFFENKPNLKRVFLDIIINQFKQRRPSISLNYLFEVSTGCDIPKDRKEFDFMKCIGGIDDLKYLAENYLGLYPSIEECLKKFKLTNNDKDYFLNVANKYSEKSDYGVNLSVYNLSIEELKRTFTSFPLLSRMIDEVIQSMELSKEEKLNFLEFKLSNPNGIICGNFYEAYDLTFEEIKKYTSKYREYSWPILYWVENKSLSTEQALDLAKIYVSNNFVNKEALKNFNLENKERFELAKFYASVCLTYIYSLIDKSHLAGFDLSEEQVQEIIEARNKNFNKKSGNYKISQDTLLDNIQNANDDEIMIKNKKSIELMQIEHNTDIDTQGNNFLCCFLMLKNNDNEIYGEKETQPILDLSTNMKINENTSDEIYDETYIASNNKKYCCIL